MNNTDKNCDAEACVSKALELKRQGYNCAQCVLMTFADRTGLDAETSARAAACFGGGFGGSGGMCGVLSAMGVVEGLSVWHAPEDKVAAYARAKALKADFEAKHGSSLCRELKIARKPCDMLIADGVRTLCGKD